MATTYSIIWRNKDALNHDPWHPWNLWCVDYSYDEIIDIHPKVSTVNPLQEYKIVRTLKDSGGRCYTEKL